MRHNWEQGGGFHLVVPEIFDSSELMLLGMMTFGFESLRPSWVWRGFLVHLVFFVGE